MLSVPDVVALALVLLVESVLVLVFVLLSADVLPDVDVSDANSLSIFFSNVATEVESVLDVLLVLSDGGGGGGGGGAAFSKACFSSDWVTVPSPFVSIWLNSESDALVELLDALSNSDLVIDPSPLLSIDKKRLFINVLVDVPLVSDDVLVDVEDELVSVDDVVLLSWNR